MNKPECNCLKSLRDYLKRESATTPNLTCVTFYFLVRNLTCMINISIINIYSLLCKDFYVEHRGCTEWLKLINLFLVKISKMVKILKILKILKMINRNLLSSLIYVTPYLVSYDCDDISEYHPHLNHHSSTIPSPCKSICMQFCGFVVSVLYAICSFFLPH